MNRFDCQSQAGVARLSGASTEGSGDEAAQRVSRGVWWVDDDNVVVRRGMVASLTAERIPVVGESSSFRPPPRLAVTSVLVFDAGSPGADAVSAAHAGQVRLVATLRRPTRRRLRELADAGVAGILVIDELTPEALVHTVRSVAIGRTTLSHTLLMRLLDHATHAPDAALGDLTARERQVLQMLADGGETRSIATGLNYSERTVKNVVHDVLTKLNCRTRAQAVGVAVRAGLTVTALSRAGGRAATRLLQPHQLA